MSILKNLLAFGVLLGVLGASTGAHASTPVISPELVVSPYPTRANEPAVAVGNGVYLVVWAQPTHVNVSVLGVRVRASDGAVLDAQPLRISTEMYFRAEAPAVAFDGNTFLVVFSGPTRGGTAIYGRQVRASDGAVLGSAPVLLSSSSRESHHPAVAFDGTNYLVAWWGYYSPANASSFTAVMGNWVRPSDGTPVLSNNLLISAAPQAATPQVAAGSGRLLVAWEHPQPGQGLNILGARIDVASRTLLDSTPLPLATGTEDEVGPAVSSSGDQFLVVWKDASSNLKGTRVRSSDGAVLDGAGFWVAGGALAPASMAFDGRDYRVAWQSGSTAGRGLFSARVSTQGTAASPLLLSEVHPDTTTTDVASIAAVAPGHFLVAYPQLDPQPHQYGDRIKARRVEDVPDASCEASAPTLVLNGGAELTLECRAGGTYSDPGAQAFDGCGNPLVVHAYNTGSDSSGPGPLLGSEGTYSVSYSAWDAAGRTVNASRTVHVDDRTAPSLALRGAAFMTHTCGSQWVDPGVEAMDACYGNLSHTVWRSGEVNGWAEGTYTVTYSLTDSGGNTATPVTRTVEVVDCPW
jgi:hypothetical protein